MKRIVMAICAIMSLFGTAEHHTCTAREISTTQQEQTRTNIHDRIMQAFWSGMETHNNAQLDALIQELTLAYRKESNPQLLYWKAYALYHNSLYYLKSAKEEKKAGSILTEGIDLLVSVEQKNSEDYALLSMMQCLSCHFAGFPKVIKAARSSVKSIEQAIELDKNNLRAYYVYANNDFYTPEKFGGCKKVEEYALKALSLPAQPNEDPLHPSWGRQETYELLVSYYLKKKNREAAEKYIELGLKEFPESAVLKAAL